MLSKTVCSNCGADNAPDGARFCPSCGSGLPLSSDEVPMAAATPLNLNDTSTVTVTATSAVPEASTVTFDEEPVVHASAATAFPSPPPAAATASATTNEEGTMYAANYFLNPTGDMLAQATTEGRGGILFIESCGSRSSGKYTVPKEIASGRILSGDKIDLSYADFVHPVTTISTGTILGGLKVVVPRGVRVETRGLGILGGFKGLNNTVHAGQEAPLVVVQGLAILGGVKVSLNRDAPPLRVIK